jgi:CDP-6-deoxy-D-xylo-4-hexulose-3-dehydrase
MMNNISRSDLDFLISYLKGEDPKLTQGPKVKKFENDWSKWLGVKHSVMVNSGSSANDLTMIALKEMFGAGEVIVPPLTWVSDISAVLRAGLEPVFVDIDRKSLAMDTSLIIKALSPRTKAVFITHVLGFNGLTDRLLTELKERDIVLVEDVCESHGAMHNGRKVGTFGWASNFSFYYAHHMTTIEGGMISTNHTELYDLLLMLRSHGMVRESSSIKTKEKYSSNYPDLNPDFIFAHATHNMRSTELNAVLGIEQLKRLDDNIDKRNKNFNKFLSVIDPNIFQTRFNNDGNSNYAFTLILLNPNNHLRNDIENCLSELKVEFRRGLSGGGNQLRQPYLKNLPGIPPANDYPEVEHIHNFAWYIGNYPDLAESKIIELVEILNSIGRKYAHKN